METLKQVIHDIKYQHSTPNKPKITKEYIYHLQSEIDNLEEQLFDSQRNYNDNQTSMSTSAFKQSGSIYQQRSTIQSAHQSPTKQLDHNQHSDLYKIILKEREEIKELDSLRQEEFNQLKEAKYRFEQLEDDNCLLQNNMNKLQVDRVNQTNKIKELQKEIDLLRRKRENKIETQRQKLNNQFS